MTKLTVQGNNIATDDDYICLTDMAKSFENSNSLIEKWIRNKNTIEFLGVWESLKNPDFNYPEFEGIKNQAGLNRFTLSVKQWIKSTNAVGIKSKPGRYGGTYAEKNIAYEFAAWLSPVFKLYLINEFDRLKEIESNEYNLEWKVKRVLSKVNYAIHTDSVKNYIIPQMSLEKDKEWIVYAQEADLLNVALIGCTASYWRQVNPELASKGDNLRDYASINELTVLSNLESLNSEMIANGIDKRERFLKLKETATRQLEALKSQDFIKSIKHLNKETYPKALNKKNKNLSNFNKNLKKALDHNPKKAQG